jgi:hypothetical protein
MKTLPTTLLLVLCSITSFAQADSVEMRLPWKPGQEIELNLKFAETIVIEAWNKKEIFLKGKVMINGGELNQAHTMDSVINDESITINTDLDENFLPGNHCCDCFRKGMNFTYSKKGKNQTSICTEIYYIVYLPAGADMKLETISGSIKISNMKGAIDAESVSGEVNVIIPEGQKADVLLKTVTGRASTVPEIPVQLVQGLRPMLSRKLEGPLNGGGKKVRLESVTGDVSLRSLR